MLSPLTDEFLQKYNTFNSDIKFGDLRSYLNYALDKDSLLQFLESRGELDSITSLIVNLNKLNITGKWDDGLELNPLFY